MPTNLDTDCLRTLCAITHSGSFAGAASRIGRTVSAVSLQIRRLETQAGVVLFRKSGRRMVLTEDGERFLTFARRLLEINDAAVEAMVVPALAGTVRFGAIQDFADSVLPAMLRRFSESHPDVRIDVRVDRSKSLTEALEKGDLDVVLAVAGVSSAPASMVLSEPMIWIKTEEVVIAPERPLPLILFDPPCVFRAAAIRALDAVGRDWSVVYTSPSLSGLHAAVKAGLGVTIRTPRFLGAGPGLAGPDVALPDLPDVEFAMYGPTTPATDLVTHFKNSVVAELGPIPPVNPMLTAVPDHAGHGKRAEIQGQAETG